MNEEIKLLDELLDDYENGLLELGSSARKCYLNKQEKKMNNPTWVHDDELKNFYTLRKLSKGAYGVKMKNM